MVLVVPLLSIFWRNQVLDVNKKVNQWNDEELNAIRNIITNEFKVEGAVAF